MISATMIVFGSAMVLMLLWFGRQVLLLLFAGVLLAVLLRMPADRLQRLTGLDERWTVSIVLLLTIATLVAVAWIAGPLLVDQLQSLQSGLTRSFRELRTQMQGSRIGAALLDSLPSLDDAGLQQLWQRAAGIWATVLGAVGSLLLVLTVSVFFAYRPSLYIDGLLRLVPLHRRARACEVAGRLHRDLRLWLIGQLQSMVVLWLLTWIALWAVGVPMAFMLAVLAGLLNFIPYIGPLFALLPVAAVAFVESPQTGLLAIAAYMLAQLIEGNVVLPLIYQHLIRLPPALTLAGQLFLGSFTGLLGIALATPLVAVALVLVRMLYVEDTLGDTMQRSALPRDGPEAPGGRR